MRLNLSVIECALGDVNMPRKVKVGSRVLKAVSSALRLDILRLLSDRGPMSYTEIMNLLKLNPARDAGRFAYHLKTLLNMDLIEPDVESRKYTLTSLGKAVVEFADQLDESAYRKKLLVRTSRLAIENFDGNKIAESLVREADVPVDLAQKIAKETEKRLLKIDTKYLTAPLIREFVNTVLIERGLEEYRHKLTRLGFPVYDVTQLIKVMGARSEDVEAVHAAAGNRVIEEYTLLNVLPRDIADAHLSGALNISNLGCWILKINALMHDLRYFFRFGITFKNGYSQLVSVHPPKNFKSALALVADVLKLASAEISCEQVLDYFNVFMAPYVRGLSREDAKEEIRLFLTTVNLSVPTGVSLGLEMRIPDYLAEGKVFAADGSVSSVYGDYTDESRLVASLLLECLKEYNSSKPIFNPSLIAKIRPEVLSDAQSEKLLYETHELAANGLPYFANLCSQEQVYASYAATGLRLAADWKEDWEMDTLGAGCVDQITANLPRALYESRKDKNRLQENLYDISEKTLRALEIKSLTIRQRAREGLLPFLMQKKEQDPYFRLENSSRVLSFVGLNEMAYSMTGKALHENDASMNFAEETMSQLSKIVRTHAKKQGARCSISMIAEFTALRRLASLDIEKYGLAEVQLLSEKDQPCYTDLSTFPKGLNMDLQKFLNVQEKLHTTTQGGHLAKIPLEQSEADPSTLLSTSKRIMSSKIGLYTYDTELTHCSNCQKTFRGEQTKCPICGSVNAVTRFRRQNARYGTKRT